MRVFELLQEEDEQSKGTYAAVKFSQKTIDQVVKYIEENDIPNATPADKLHCTVLYSRKYCPDYEPQGEIDPPYIGECDKLEVWESKGKLRDQEPTRCLVLKFKCPALNERHEELMDEHDATYDFPEYKTHITLSYDIGDMDESTLPDPCETITTIEVVKEYGEDLDLDWASKNTGKK